MVLLSIIIPAHDEAPVLGATVDALHHAARAAGLAPAGLFESGSSEPGSSGLTPASQVYEIIVAADACRDGTAEVARAHGALVVEVEHRQISRTRNAGASIARGQRLLFVDADTIVPPQALRGALAALDAGCIGGGAGVTFDGDVPRWARVLLPLVLWSFRVFRLTGGCFLFCTREAFDAVKGWDETVFAGEEILMCRDLKRLRRGPFRIIRTPVVTSGRKLRAYSGWEVLRRSLAISIRGRSGVSRRDRLDLWYDRRPDPALAPPSAAPGPAPEPAPAPARVMRPGFTLIELLVSLVISAILLAIVLTTLVKAYRFAKSFSQGNHSSLPAPPPEPEPPAPPAPTPPKPAPPPPQQVQPGPQ